ncbi:hypothetical protein GCM10023323_67340 [Streptomyces thinghirensis]|uniref:Uncharacterized protein n=1 Tax=Streptomyces thinghirensis TaxID=551547 RepID=A0ABP9TEB3_9ACTN
MGDSFEMGLGVLVEFGRRAASGEPVGQWAEAGGGHAQEALGAGVGESVEAGSGGVFGEMAENESCPVDGGVDLGLPVDVTCRFRLDQDLLQGPGEDPSST